MLYAKIGDKVQEGKPLYRVYSESTTKLENALKQIDEVNPIEVGKKVGDRMLKKRIGKPTVSRREFILDR